MSAPRPPQSDRDSFDPDWYLRTNPDVRAAGMDPWDHYRTAGYAEGRAPAEIKAFALDHMLWRGFPDIALPALQTLKTGSNPREMAVASWVLARWELDQGNAQGAYDALQGFWRAPATERGIAHAGPALLSVHLALANGDVPGALHHLETARTEPLIAPADLALAELTVALAQNAAPETLNTHLAALTHPVPDLVPLRLAEGATGPLFSALSAPAPAPAGTQATDPLVSVILPVFNGAATLARALDGLCAQSWQALEIIVVDDASTDETVDIARNRAASDPRIRVLTQTENTGAYPARNAGLAAAKGAYVTVHDADDWSHPQKIEAQVTALITDPDLAGSLSHWVRMTPDMDMGLGRIEQGWVHRNVSSLMVRAGVRDRLGYWDRTRANADTEYYYRILHSYGAHSLHEVHAGVPLAFGLTDAGSLTQQTATHLRTQYHGVRRDYMDAAAHWHHRTDGDPYLPQHPPQRPFNIPAVLGVGDPDAAPNAYDALMASDLFDPQWYKLAHRDVLEADISPVHHYLTGGALEDRDVGPDFATGAYRIAQDLEEGTIPLLHFLAHNKGDTSTALPVFDGALANAPSEQPRVMVFAHAAGPVLFGAERSLLDVIARMVGRGLVPVVVLPSLRNSDYLDRLRAVSAQVIVQPQLQRHGWRTPDAAAVDRIRALIRRHAPVEAHVNTLVQDIPLLAARAEGVPAILHIREMPHEDATLCAALAITPDALRDQLLVQADRFVVNSPLLANWVAAPERTQLRPNSVNPALFDLPFQPGETLHVALISSNILKKGLVDFLTVARKVEAMNRPIRFLLIGPATRDLHLMQPLPANVDFRDYSDTPLKAVAQADVVVNLSHFTESFGRTVMEAMAAARPVVTYDRGTPAVLVDSGTTGFVVPADDPDSVARCILALEAARGQLLAMGRAGQARARALQALAEQDV